MITGKSGLLYKNHKLELIILQLKKSWKVLFITLGISGGLLLILFIISLLTKTPISNLTRDPMQIVDAPFYTGILSNIGILFWSAISAICLFSFFLLIKEQQEKAIFLLSAGSFTLLLLLDDFFLLHEVVYRNYMHIPQRVVFFVYLILLSLILIRFRNIILKSEFPLLAAALTLFLISGFIDALPQNILPFHHLFEDGSKFIGIVFWFIYFLRTSYHALWEFNNT